MTVHVELRGFGWRHAGRRAWAVRGVDLRIERGERVLLLGPSGAGKSTLLAALAGLLAEDSGEQEGEIRIGGRPARTARDEVGIVFQDPQSQLIMSRAGDDVAFGLENRGVPTDRIWSEVDSALAAVGFGYPRDRPTAALSGGEQQRLALAGAIASRPELLLLDEPTANLDPDGANLVRGALVRVTAARRSTMILVEHRVADALALIDRVVVLGPAGGVIADGTPERVFAEDGRHLAELGVWVPGRPVLPRRAGTSAGPVLLTASDVAYRSALASVSCEVRAEETLAVVGPNGAGKTTLALVLGGLLAPTTGSVSGLGHGAPHRWRANLLARRIGSVFQDPEHQFLRTRVRDELTLSAPDRSTVDELLERLHLNHLSAANPFTLSGGEQRRLSVATALAAAPRVLILDEPTFGQDRRTWVELVDLFAKLRDDGCGVVSVTHDADFVDALADRTLALTGVRA